jgi:pre-mRNA-splicing helicase BRR2
MHSKLVKELSFPEAERLYLEEDGIKEFDPIVTQVFNKLYLSSESIFIGAPNGGQDSRTLAELAIWQEVQSEGFDKIVYICPVESMCKQRAAQWKQRLGSQSEVGLNIDSLTGNLQQDLAILNKADVIVTTAEKWDMMSRKWRQRKVIQRVGLYILDQLQILDATYEVVASRIRFMQNEVERKIRIVALSTPLANAKDVANWLGISFPGNTFNFHPSVRPTPLEIHIQGFDHNNKAVRILAMHRPAYNAMKKALPSTGSRES